MRFSDDNFEHKLWSQIHRQRSGSQVQFNLFEILHAKIESILPVFKIAVKIAVMAELAIAVPLRIVFNLSLAYSQIRIARQLVG